MCRGCKLVCVRLQNQTWIWWIWTHWLECCGSLLSFRTADWSSECLTDCVCLLWSRSVQQWITTCAETSQKHDRTHTVPAVPLLFTDVSRMTSSALSVSAVCLNETRLYIPSLKLSWTILRHVFPLWAKWRHKQWKTLRSIKHFSHSSSPSLLFLPLSSSERPACGQHVTVWVTCLTLITCWHPCHGCVFKHYLMTNTSRLSATVLLLMFVTSRRHRPPWLQRAGLWRIGNSIWHSARGQSAQRCIHWPVNQFQEHQAGVLLRERTGSALFWVLGNQLNVWFPLQGQTGPKSLRSCQLCHLFMHKRLFQNEAVTLF